MKKFCCLLLVLCLLLAALPGTSAESSFGRLVADTTDAELLELLALVQSELVSRRIERTADLPSGTYIGGRDLPVGAYILTECGEEKDYGILSLRAASDPEDRRPSKLYDLLRGGSGYTAYLTLDEGDKLILPFSFRLTVSGGILFR